MPVSEPRILILGGTAEASSLADALSRLPVTSISSLAGRTANPDLPSGKVRIGGFGGIDGLIAYLDRKNIDLVIDATHPYALTISQNAIAAAKAAGIAHLRLERPQWLRKPGDNWINVPDETDAALRIPLGERVLLALGRQHIAPFAKRNDVHFIMRMIDPPEVSLPANREIILAKPGDFDTEKHFLIDKRIGLIICRNSGGALSYQKIRAARDLALRVIMIARPLYQGAEMVSSVDEAVLFIKSHFML
ncbi:cobalt-precorrin-6A reductase [Brucella sp. BE17]|uniref:cobalt-precorrin-6A reductase n=1 Tax=Brucella sp. BE17 TaxID=3142977 RepID=UPI0031B9B0DC